MIGWLHFLQDVQTHFQQVQYLIAENQLRDVRRVDVAPMFGKILHDKSAMAVLWQMFAAQQTTAGDDLNGDRFLNATLAHEFKELLLINVPIAVVLLVSVKNVLCWSQFRKMDVLNAVESFQEELQVFTFRESGKLGRIVQSNIDNPLHASLVELGEERFSRLLSESYCVRVNAVHCHSPSRGFTLLGNPRR
jgi:hypothetical protein